MTDKSKSGVMDKVHNYGAYLKLTEHDARLMRNDPVVANLAHALAQAIRDHGVEKVASAFRGALAMEDYHRRML